MKSGRTIHGHGQADFCHGLLGVGTFPNCVSPYGLIDMGGNLWEWCADVFERELLCREPAA